MGLTAVAIKAAKGGAKQYKLADSDGLYLLVKPSGGRYWRINYRFRGFHRTLAFGAWPEVALIDARQKRDEARREIARGIDPGEKLKLDRIAAKIAAAITFRSVAEEWLTKTQKEGLSAITLKKIGCFWLLPLKSLVIGQSPKSRRMNCWGSCGKLKGVGVMCPPSASARFAVRSFAMELRRRVPTVM